MKKWSSVEHPTQGKNHSASEDGGEPGYKEPMPSQFGSMTSDEGYHDDSKMKAFNASHGRPTCSHYPENVSGAIETNEPTKGEGSTPGY